MRIFPSRSISIYHPRALLVENVREETLRELPIEHQLFFMYRLIDHFPDTYSLGTSRVRFLTRRPSSIRYPFTQSLTHSAAHLPVATSRGNADIARKITAFDKSASS